MKDLYQLSEPELRYIFWQLLEKFCDMDSVYDFSDRAKQKAIDEMIEDLDSAPFDSELGLQEAA